eukprot:scaffold1690_cov177-Ochromonas_danica.AAC.6
MNLRDKQIQCLSKMLNLTNADCRDIISPLLNVGALRQRGVTLHLLIQSEREAVPDAPVVYFIRPTESNVKKIAEDCTKQLYRAAYVNFLTRIERPLLEKFAQDLVGQGAVSSVAKVYDQYLDFIALESNLFTLNIPHAFSLYNEPSLKEQDIRSFMHRVAMGLVSMVRVLGSLPIIRAPRGGAAEMLAQEVNTLLKEAVFSRGPVQAIFEDCLVAHDRARPLMIVVDRASDFFPVLQHTSAYQALISDLLDCKLNRVTVEVQEKGLPNGVGGGKKKTYDLNTQSDTFLAHYAGAPFPEAVDANEKELADVIQREQAIRSRPDFNEASAIAGGAGEGKGRDLSEAIESLPEILSKKSQLEAHTSVMQAVMRGIAQREVPTYFEAEQAMLTAGARAIDRPSILALLRDGSKGFLQDKARLLMLLAALGDPTSLSKVGAEEYDTAFTTGCAAMTTPPSTETVNRALEAVRFLRRLISLQSPSSMLRGGGSGGGYGGSGSGGQNALLSTFLDAAQNRANSLFTKAAAFFTKFIPFYVSRVVDSLAEGREDESFCYLDPRASQTGNSLGSGSGGSGQKYSDVIVFVVGGGSYAEYFNLQELLRDKMASANSGLRNILYGCSDLISGDAFLNQLETLATGGASSSSTTPTGK